MDMLYVVYDLDGKMFEVPAYKVKALIDKGWTPWNPINPPKFVLENSQAEKISGHFQKSNS
jgi:hypothetical protein